MINHSEIVMVNAASRALNYYDKNPRADTEEIMREVVQSLDAVGTKIGLKISGIAAANEALKLKKQDKSKTNKQILQMIINNSKNLLAGINEGLEE